MLALSGHADLRFEKLPTVGFRRFIRRRFSVLFGDLPAAFRSADRFIANLNRRSFSAWAALPRRRRCWPAGCAVRRHSFTNRTLSPEKPTAGRPGSLARSCSASRKRDIFSKGPHRSHRHADSHRAETVGSTSGPAKVGPARRSAHAAGDGRKPGRERDQSGNHQVAPASARLSLQIIHLTGARDERLVADNYHRDKIPAYVAAFHHQMESPYSAAGFCHRASRRRQPGRDRVLRLARDSHSVSLRGG